jgi:entericidin B
MMFKKTFALMLTTVFLIGSIAALTGCNTVEGAGKDIEKGGKAIKDEASEHN